MSLEQHSIDQGYSARLNNLEVTPPVHAWAAIAAQLPNEKADEKGAWWWGSGAASATLTPEEKSKRERVIFWWWTGALMALATISMLAYYGMNAASTTDNPTPTPKPSAAALVPIAATSNDDANQDVRLSSGETEEITSAATTNTAPNSSQSVAEVLPAPLAVPTATKRDRSDDGQSRMMTQSKVASNHVVTSSNSNNKEVASSSTTTQLLEGSLAPTDTKSTTPPNSTNPVGLSMASTSMNELPFSDLSLLELGATKLPLGPGIGCEDFKNRASWSFAVRAFAGPGTVFQNFTSTDQTAPYEMLRDSIENKQLSVHGGLRFEAVNDRGLFLRAGADYMMYRSNVVDVGAPRTRTIIDSVFMEDTQTWRVETRNEVFQEERNVYNRQHAIVLTAGVGFRKTFGNVSPYIMVEGGYEFLFKKRGDFVLPDGNFVDLSEDEDNLYINDRPGFQFGGVIGVDFALTDRIEAGISGHYKQLGGLRGSADLLDYDQSTAFGALNLRYTIR